MRSATRLCSRTNRVCRLVNSGFSFTRASPAMKFPLASIGSMSPGLVFIFPPWNVRSDAAVVASDPYTIDPSIQEVTEFTCCRGLATEVPVAVS